MDLAHLLHTLGIVFIIFCLAGLLPGFIAYKLEIRKYSSGRKSISKSVNENLPVNTNVPVNAPKNLKYAGKGRYIYPVK